MPFYFCLFTFAFSLLPFYFCPFYFCLFTFAFLLLPFYFCLFTFSFLLLPFYFCLSTFAFLLLPFYFCLFTFAFLLLPFYFCLFTFAFLLFPFYFCLFTFAFLLLPFYFCLFTFAFCLPRRDIITSSRRTPLRGSSPNDIIIEPTLIDREANAAFSAVFQSKRSAGERGSDAAKKFDAEGRPPVYTGSIFPFERPSRSSSANYSVSRLRFQCIGRNTPADV